MDQFRFLNEVLHFCTTNFHTVSNFNKNLWTTIALKFYSWHNILLRLSKMLLHRWSLYYIEFQTSCYTIIEFKTNPQKYFTLIPFQALSSFLVP